MKVWLGHYVDNTKEWFITWARNVQELVLMIDGIIGEPSERSLRQLLRPGFVNCHVHFSKDGIPSFSLAKDRTLRENWLRLEGTVGREEKAIDHIQRVARHTKNSSAKETKIWLGTYEHKDKTAGDECFIVWAPSKEEALELVSQKSGKSFEKHLRLLSEPGYINIHVGFKSGKISLTPPKEDVESGLWIYMEDFE